MTSLIRTIRDWIRHIPKNAPLNYTQITENLFISQGYTANAAIKLVESKRSEADLNPPIRKRIQEFEHEWRQKNID